MRKTEEYHIPVFLKEALDLLKVGAGKKFIDATLGGGGHSEEILRRGGELLAIDRDPDAINYAKKRLIERFAGLAACPAPKIVQGNFENIKEIADQEGYQELDGVLFDLGVSSHQLETPGRGFSFNQEGSLDMRMDPGLTVTAKDLINGLNEGELRELFDKFGGEKSAKKIAREICEFKKTEKIENCNQLANLILSVCPKRGKFDRTHPATRIFQALRIAVNDELDNFKKGLPKAINLLKPEGRIVVISFHSLEDRIVKKVFLEKEKEKIIKIITRKPVVPSCEEQESNPRSKSAKLRAAEKI